MSYLSVLIPSSSLCVPPAVTVCNRTLYGEINKTYEVEVPKPSNVPFDCTINLTALGEEHGDIVQVGFFRRVAGQSLVSFAYK